MFPKERYKRTLLKYYYPVRFVHFKWKNVSKQNVINIKFYEKPFPFSNLYRIRWSTNFLFPKRNILYEYVMTIWHKQSFINPNCICFYLKSWNVTINEWKECVLYMRTYFTISFHPQLAVMNEMAKWTNWIFKDNSHWRMFQFQFNNYVGRLV